MRKFQIVLLLEVVNLLCGFYNHAFCQKTLSIKSFEVQDCEATLGETPILRTRIISAFIDHKKLHLTFCFADVCCVHYTPTAILFADSLAINLEPKGNACECTCVKEGTIVLDRITKVPERFSLQGKSIFVSDEKYETFPRKFELLGKDTVNQRDGFGVMQGIWTRDTVQLTSYREYKDNALLKDVVLYPNGKVKSQIDHVPSSYCHYVEFFETGQKRKECFVANNAPNFKSEPSPCKEWNEAGELVYDGVFRK